MSLLTFFGLKSKEFEEEMKWEKRGICWKGKKRERNGCVVCFSFLFFATKREIKRAAKEGKERRKKRGNGREKEEMMREKNKNIFP